MTPSLTLSLAQYAAATTIETIPQEVKDRAKQVILDEMASAYFARRGAAGDLAARYAASFGGSTESRILGTRLRANFKFLRAGYPIHAVIEAAMAVVAEHKLNVDSITSIHVGMPANAMRVVDNRKMHNICVQDMLSAALLRGGLSLNESYFPAILSDPAFAPMRTRIALGVDPGLERDQPNGRGAKVTITVAGGSSFSRRVDHPRGHSLRGGITWPELSDKWHDALPECDVDRMLALAQRLDDLEDVGDLSDAFSATS